MGLRERNATRTREHIVSAAIDLFVEQGYDATTMEQVAVRAEVGTSTLYRYFPTKERLAVAPLGAPDLMARTLADRPHEEPVQQSLGAAILALVEDNEVLDGAGRGMRDILLSHDRPRAQALEWLQEAQVSLIGALAERMGLPADDLRVTTTAWGAIFVLQSLDDPRHAGRPQGEVARELMSALSSIDWTPPAVP